MVLIIWLIVTWYREAHYGDAIMGTIASQITSLTIVYSTVYSDVDQRKHQSSVSLAFVRGIHRWPVNSPYKWPVTRKIFPFDDVIMINLNTLQKGLHLTHCIREYSFEKKHLLLNNGEVFGNALAAMEWKHVEYMPWFCFVLFKRVLKQVLNGRFYQHLLDNFLSILNVLIKAFRVNELLSVDMILLKRYEQRHYFS